MLACFFKFTISVACEHIYFCSTLLHFPPVLYAFNVLPFRSFIKRRDYLSTLLHIPYVAGQLTWIHFKTRHLWWPRIDCGHG